MGDILDESPLRRAFEKYRPHTVFHAAAYKHVPMLELQPWQAVEKNIITLGLMNLPLAFSIPSLAKCFGGTIHSIVKNLLLKIYNRPLFREKNIQNLAKGAFLALSLKIVGVGLSFLLNVLIARRLGPSATGLFFLALTMVSVAGVFGCMGLENTFLRYTAAGVAQKNWESIKGLYQKGITIAVPFSVCLTGLVYFFSRTISHQVFHKPELTTLIRLMALAILPTVLILLHAELLKGLQRTRDYIMVHSIGVPAVSLIAFAVLCIQMELGVLGAVWAHILAVFVTALFGFGLWRLATKSSMKRIKGRFPWHRLLKSSIPLFWVTIMNFSMMWATTLALGAWGTSAQVGIYTTAYRTSMLTSFILIAVNTVAAPKYAEYYSLNQLNRLEDMALSSVKIMCFLALPPLIVFMVFPHWIMGLFGSEFMSGGRCLSILACGQFVNVATGSVGYILMMSGHENLMRNAITLSGTLNVILNLWLVPKYNIMGGAIATAISLATLNMIAAYFVWTAVKIKPLPLPFLNSRY